MVVVRHIETAQHGNGYLMFDQLAFFFITCDRFTCTSLFILRTYATQVGTLFRSTENKYHHDQHPPSPTSELAWATKSRIIFLYILMPLSCERSSGT